MSTRLIPLKELGPAKGIPYSRAQIYRMIGEGRFPRPVKLGEHRIAFVEQEVDAWIKAKIAERDATGEAA